tara:strand:- start:57 stop:245 length:189 start_codon:yes stop_codon:yes gene_type:complete
MRTSEDVVYEAYSEGNDHVAALFVEVRRLTKLGGKYKHMETTDKFDIAYRNVKEKEAKKQQN